MYRRNGTGNNGNKDRRSGKRGTDEERARKEIETEKKSISTTEVCAFYVPTVIEKKQQ